jgi:DNA-binding transcriptional MerR regulator/mannose-6-phosphate isomerase-like protein (cupin superfamily)
MKIGDVARLVHVSPSALRSWENLGLLNPPRTPSRYRLYSTEDLRLLKRARFLRRVRGLNPPAIVHLLRSQGQLRRSRPRAATASDRPILGKRLRSLRFERGLSLAAVANATGVSVAFVSALERSQTAASVATLRRLARFYNLNVLDFFDPPRSNPYLVKPRERKLLEAGPGVRMELLAWGNAIMEPHLFRIKPRAGSGESYSHEGEEFLHILQGELEISLDDGEAFRLEAGDSFYFESTMSHRWSNPGKKETWVLWVNTPRTF